MVHGAGAQVGEGVGPAECVEGLGALYSGGNMAPDAAVFGRAKKLGVGLGICWSCDFRICSQNEIFELLEMLLESLSLDIDAII